MRNKLLAAFLAVIITALVSNFIYQSLTVRDFEDYVRGVRADHTYWIMAAVEGSYVDGAWNRQALREAVHWAIMLGFDVKVTDMDGTTVTTADEVMGTLPHEMRHRMSDLIDIQQAQGPYEQYPLYMGGGEIGTMFVRSLKQRGEMDNKAMRFLDRGKNFLIISFFIAGGGAVILSLILTYTISLPLRRMKQAVEAMASGDLAVRTRAASRDEIGMLAGSFNYMAEALQREEALRKHLTSNIAHELRTPLTVMKANAEAMIDGVMEDRQRGLQNIADEIDRLISLVGGIEDITQAEASFFERHECVLIDIREFLLRLADKMRPVASAKGLDLQVNAAGNLQVCTEPDKLERIVQNIVSNAVRYTDRGSVTIGSEGGDDGFIVTVSDTGPGIPEELRARLFERFTREPGSPGFGLGLAIVKELVQVMGGRVDFTSVPGKGSAFRVSLPNMKAPGA